MLEFKENYTKEELAEIAKNPEDLEFFVEKHRDFINSPKHNYSLQAFMKANPGGASSQSVIKMLNLKNEEELDLIYKSALKKLRTALGAK